MPTLEVHTLNQENALVIADVLAVRAGAIAAGVGAAALLPATKASETSGAFSFDEVRVLDHEPEGPAMTVLGEYMPALEKAHEDFELLQESELLGDLMHRARLSKLTGCIMLDYARNHKGYTRTGIKAVQELGLGTTSRESHRVVHFARLAETTGKLPTVEEKAMEVDHVCRNPACIYHTRLLDGNVNNQLMAEARIIEPEILGGKVFYIADRLDEMPWLRHTIAKEGEIPLKVLSTRDGPRLLRQVMPNELVVVGERIECDVFDSLRPPGKKPEHRKSRAKINIPKSIDGHQVLFTKTKYRKKHIPDQEEKLNASKKYP